MKICLEWLILLLTTISEMESGASVCTPGPSNKAMIETWEKTQSVSDMKKMLLLKYPFISWDCSDLTLNTSIRRLNEKVKQLKRNKNEKQYQLLLAADFCIPKPETDPFTSLPPESQTIFKKVNEKTNEVLAINKELKRDIEHVEASNENLTYQINNSEHKISILMNLLEINNKKYENTLHYKQDSYKLEEELRQLEEQYSNLARQLDETAEELNDKKEKMKRMCTRNVNKKLKRREETISKQSQIISEKEREIRSVKAECEEKSNEVKDLQKEKKNLLVKVCRLRKSRDRNIVEINQNLIEALKSEIRVKEKEIIELQQTNAILMDPMIESFQDGKFSNEIRSTIMSLITECGVSQNKVNNVIKIVLRNLTGKTLSRLPSTGVKSRLMVEAKRVAQSQVAEAMLTGQGQELKGNTLHQDGTSKFHRHFQSFQITTSEGTTLSAGMSEVARGDATTLTSEFHTLIKDLARSLDPSKSSGHNTDTAKLIVSIIATMSDQGSVNPVFNEKFKKIREDLLPVVFQHWDTLSPETKQEMGTLFSFFCKMHLFVNMANETDKCLLQFERNIISTGRNPYSFSWNESGAVRLVRTVSKALTSHGCEKSGVGGHFLTYLKEKGIDNKLITFRGHRFNHLFYASGATFFHLTDIKDFLLKWSDPNELLKSIRFDVEEIVYVSGIRALGIIDKVVTGPLWRLVEKSPNVLALNKQLYQLKIQLEQWARDASPVLSGESMFDEHEASISKDDVYECLIAPTENPVLDTYTQMALELCFGGMLLILERQAKDQLPGGKYWDIDQRTLDRVSSVPSTNTASERDFAQLDMLMRAKPSASTTAYESVIMWSNNKTSAWLASLSEEDYRNILDDARKNAPSMCKQMKIKQQLLYEGKLKHLHERQQKKQLQEEKAYSSKVKLTQKLSETGGLWLTNQQLFSYKDNHSEKVFKEALIIQISFRKMVLGCKGPKELFQQQFKGKVYTVNELENNLRQIMLLNENFETETAEPKLVYCSPEDAQELVSGLKSQLRGKVEEGRMKILISQQKTLLPKLIDNPILLEGKQVRHKCRDPETSVIEWLSGKVLKISKQYQHNTIKTEYIIKYEEEPDSEWCFPLLKDMEKGDLIIDE